MTPVYIIIDEYGNKYYYKDKAMTILHREDGPAIELAGGGKAWYINGKRHRKDGPAIEDADGHKEWYVDGVKHDEREFLLKTAKEIVLTIDEIASKFGIEVSKLKIQK